MDDDEMMSILGSALRATPESGAGATPSARALEQAVRAGRWVRIDEELAELVTDSAHEPVLTGLRGPADEVRMLTYRLDDLTLECEVGSDALWGQAVGSAGASPVRLELLTPDGAAAPLDVDADGRFLLSPVPAGPLGIRCIRDGRPPAMTPWFLA
jgi:hypothetical protein